MNTYKCFYNNKSVEIQAMTTYAAQLMACGHFKVPKGKKHMVTIVLAAKNGIPVISPADF